MSPITPLADGQSFDPPVSVPVPQDPEPAVTVPVTAEPLPEVPSEVTVVPKAEPQIEPAPRRGRGRPPGRKNKPRPCPNCTPQSSLRYSLHTMQNRFRM